MPDRIHLLPDSVANQIAAGEVIQRPASVIKELVENAVDAGADDIRIYIKDAGRTLIQVVDNGSGMSETDARMAFERHATSKILQAQDLFTLRTMGFRGEALPSICAIAQIELRSRLREAPVGTRLVISGSKVESQEPDVCEAGTNIMVKNLFYNVPARRKFLKSDNVELSNIMREFERLALVNTGVRMSIDTGSKTIDLRKGSFLQRISDIWKGNLSQQLIPIEAETPAVKISGFVSRPEYARRRNPLQYFIVNGRNMRHPYFHKAVINCFTGLLAPDTMPNYFIKFDVDPASIDVNIHPTKNEIKFEEDMLIWSVLTAAIKASLGKHAAVPSIDFETGAIEIKPSREGEETAQPKIEVPLDYNPFETSLQQPAAASRQSTGSGHRTDEPKARNWDRLYEGFMRNTENFAAEQTSILETESCGDGMPSLCLQYADKYIITIGSGGVILIDQHRAHLKVIYEKIIKGLEEGEPMTQILLFPEPLVVEPQQEEALQEVAGLMTDIGFVIEKEEGEYMIAGVPPMLGNIPASEVMTRILESVSEGSENYGDDSPESIAAALKNKVALSMARSLAVKRGRKLTAEEMEGMVAELFSLPDPAVTPSGRRIFTVIDENHIQRLLP